MSLDVKVPKFEQIKRVIEKKISSGVYAHGDYLPSEDELSRFFKAGRNTIRRVTQELLKSGIIVKQQGRLSLINYPPEQQQTRICNRLAWFNYSPLNTMDGNTIYFEMFKNAVLLAADRNMQVDFLSTDDPDFWHIFSSNQDCYVGAFSVGVTQRHLTPELFNLLQALPNLIAIDEVSVTPARHCVSTDNYESAKLAVQHLVAKGYRNIKFLRPSNSHEYAPFQERQRGFETALREANLQVTADSILIANEQAPLYNLFIDQHIKQLHNADAVFAVTDHMAIDLIYSVRHYGIEVPRDLAVVGFDGMFPGQHIHPRLTTIQQPYAEVVEAAFNLALELDKNPKSASRRIRLAGHLIEGESVLNHHKIEL